MLSDKLKELSEYYNELYFDEQLFCDLEGCSDCKGTDINGEPNGYGCEAQEEFFIKENEKYKQIEDDETNAYYKKEDIEKLLPTVKKQELLIKEMLRIFTEIHEQYDAYDFSEIIQKAKDILK